MGFDDIAWIDTKTAVAEARAEAGRTNPPKRQSPPQIMESLKSLARTLPDGEPKDKLLEALGDAQLVFALEAEAQKETAERTRGFFESLKPLSEGSPLQAGIQDWLRKKEDG